MNAADLILIDAEGTEADPIRVCCAAVRKAHALPLIRLDLGPDPVYGYLLEPDPPDTCTCPRRWIPFDWRRGHAVFERADRPARTGGTCDARGDGPPEPATSAPPC